MANRYVRASAGGTASGNDWTNAFTALPSTLVRGDTYYVADGTYGPMILNAVAGTTLITIKYATVEDHGTSTGWDDSYSSTFALWTRSTAGTLIDIRLSNVTFDGTKTGASTLPNTSQRGLVFTTTAGAGPSYVFYNQNSTVASNVTFLNCEFASPHNTNIETSTLFWNNSTSTDLLVKLCYFSQAGQCWIHTRDVVNVTMEYNWFKNCGSGGASFHSAGLIFDATQNVNTIIRYNIVENMKPVVGSSCWIEPQNNGHTGTPSGLYIYGNVFKATDATESTALGIIALTSGDSWTTMLFYNNTIYGLHEALPGILGTANASGWVAANNLWQACDSTPTISDCTDTTNIKNTGVANFTNAAGGDFTLTSDTTAGTTLPSPYNMDMTGATRGADGVWTIGAFEFSSGASSAVFKAILNGNVHLRGNCFLK